MCTCLDTGEKEDPRMFEVEENIFDLYRGDRLPVEQSHLASEQVMEKMTVSLVNSSWAPSTRRLYHGWILVWMSFCTLVQAAALPACRKALARWIVSLSTMCATSTVHVAMSAITGWHALNDVENPIRASPMLGRLWTAVRRVNGLGVRKKKAICDHAFVAGMYRLFRGMGSMHTWVQLRSMAWFLVGFEAGMRVGEVCGLTVCCWVRLMNRNVELKIVQTKNNRWLSMMADRARLVWSEKSLDVLPSAVRFVEELWLPFMAKKGIIDKDWSLKLVTCGQIRRHGCRFGLDSAFVCDKCPPLFPTFPSGGGYGSMSRAHVTEMVKFWARCLGFDPRQFSGISFRRGSVSVAATQKIALELRMKQFRWLSEETPHVYTDMGDVEKNKVGAALHKAVGDSVRLASKLKTGDKGEDVACLVCGRKDSVAPNMIVLCDGCPCGAHVKCLGLRTVPKGDWFCRACCHVTSSGENKS